MVIGTGLDSLDRITGGLRPGLVVLCSPPGHGKTSLALGIALNASMRQGVPVAVYSLEMSRQHLMSRMIAAVSGIGLRGLMNGVFERSGWDSIKRAASRLAEAPIYIADEPNLTRPKIVGLCRCIQGKLKRDGRRLGLIVIDYLQLLRDAPPHRADVQPGAILAAGLKRLAMELDIPILAVSQLHRGRQGPMPMMRDLGPLGWYADSILCLARINNPDGQWLGKAAVVAVGKNRHGPRGCAWLRFRTSCARFEEIGGIDEAPIH